MMKKTRLSFSSLSIEEKKSAQPTAAQPSAENKGEQNGGQRMEYRSGERKRPAKSSTYQYSKKGYGRGGHHKPYSGHTGHGGQNKGPYKNSKMEKIPPPAAGVIRIIPLGGVEEIGKNMTVVEIGDDIIVIDAGMHFSNEEKPGVDYVIPNTTYLEERKD